MDPKQLTRKSKKYLKFIKSLNCVVCKRHPVDAHHIRHARYNDFLTVPLCREHHSLYHSMGHDTFIYKFNVAIDFEIINQLIDYIRSEDD